MNILYILHFVFLYTSMIYTRTVLSVFKSESYWNDIRSYADATEYEKEVLEEKTYHILYWLNADRYYWTSGDAQNLAEAFFALGNVFSICRICFLLPIIGFVGPLQVNDFHLLILTILFIERLCSNE